MILVGDARDRATFYWLYIPQGCESEKLHIRRGKGPEAYELSHPSFQSVKNAYQSEDKLSTVSSRVEKKPHT